MGEDSVLTLQFEMGTRYIIDALYHEFYGVMEKAKESGKTVDVRNCKFGPMCANIMRRYYDSVNIVDTLTESNNEILKHNIEATMALKEMKRFPTLNFGTVNSLESTRAMVSSLKSGDQYEPINVDDNRKLAALVFCIMVRPDVEFDCTNYLMQIHQFIKAEWLLSAESHDKYILLTQPDYRVVECKNGVIDDPELGKFSENTFITTLNVFPYEFGTQNCVVIDSKGKPIGEWAGVVAKILSVLGYKEWKQDSILTRLEYSK